MSRKKRKKKSPLPADPSGSPYLNSFLKTGILSPLPSNPSSLHSTLYAILADAILTPFQKETVKEAKERIGAKLKISSKSDIGRLRLYFFDSYEMKYKLDDGTEYLESVLTPR